MPTLKTYSNPVPLLAIVCLVLFLGSARTALTLGTTVPGNLTGVVDLFAFIQTFLASSVTLGVLVAILTNLLKPWIPDGYGDTAAFMVTVVLVTGLFLAKLFYPMLTFGGVEIFFQKLIDSSPTWIPVLLWLIHFISGQAHALLAGIPYIGASNSKPSIFSKHARSYISEF